jgi:hypothetical protein
MQILEIKAKVKSGKETELSQALSDLIPPFQSMLDITTQINFSEMEGDLNVKLNNSGSPKQVNDVLTNDHFILFLGSIKVLCDGYKLIFPDKEE